MILVPHFAAHAGVEDKHVRALFSADEDYGMDDALEYFVSVQPLTESFLCELENFDND